MKKAGSRGDEAREEGLCLGTGHVGTWSHLLALRFSSERRGEGLVGLGVFLFVTGCHVAQAGFKHTIQ